MKNNEEIDTQAKKTLFEIGGCQVCLCVCVCVCVCRFHYFNRRCFLKTGERSSIHIKKSL